MEASRTCVIEGCDKKVKGQGLCAGHYMRKRRYGDPTGGGRQYMAGGTVCAADGCTDRAKAKGYCPTHYMRWKKHGDPLVTVATGATHGNRVYAKDLTCSVKGCERVTKAKGLCPGHYHRRRATGDTGPSDFHRGLGWYIDNNGYKILGNGPTKRLEHRVVMEQLLGRPLRDFENVHHKNGRRADNRPANLELWVTPQPQGQRIEDLIVWVVEMYPDEVRQALQA